MEGFKSLTREDQIRQKLRDLYASYGYGRYRQGKFEPYDMYRENINFLKNDMVITFTDSTGKLMALKPDVTMSIVKSIPPDAGSVKLFYIENVFRMTPGSGEFREISQIGLESVGEADCCRLAEVITLAAKTLETIDSDHIICVSHMGLVSAVFEACGFDRGMSARAACALSGRNRSQLLSAAKEAALSPESAGLLETIVSVRSRAGDAARALRALRFNAAASAAADEIEALCDAVSNVIDTERIIIDFTQVNDFDYYTGVTFRGYVNGLPRAVLSGGGYDKLMRKFGKPQSAVGFALYLGELPRLFSEKDEYDADILLIYSDAPARLVTNAAESLIKSGKTVRVEKTPPLGVRTRQVLRLSADGSVSEVSADD